MSGDVERLKQRFREGRMTRETYLRCRDILLQIREMQRCYGRVARASLGGYVK